MHVTNIYYLAVFGIAFFLTGCATPPSADEINAISAPLIIDPAVKESVLLQAAMSKPQRSIRSIDTRTAIDNKGNFGKIIYAVATSQQSLREDGLYITTSTANTNNGQGEGKTEDLNLCGLLSIASVSTGRSRIKVTTAVPLAGAFVPLNSSSDLIMRRRTQLRSLTVIDGTLCAPEPQTNMAYSISNSVNYINSGTGTFRGDSVEILNVNCKIGAARLGKDIGLSEQYLPTHCDLIDATGVRREHEYAFLRESMQYLLLSAKTPAQMSIATFERIER